MSIRKYPRRPQLRQCDYRADTLNSNFRHFERAVEGRRNQIRIPYRYVEFEFSAFRTGDRRPPKPDSYLTFRTRFWWVDDLFAQDSNGRAVRTNEGWAAAGAAFAPPNLPPPKQHPQHSTGPQPAGSRGSRATEPAPACSPHAPRMLPACSPHAPRMLPACSPPLAVAGLTTLERRSRGPRGPRLPRRQRPREAGRALAHRLIRSRTGRRPPRPMAPRVGGRGAKRSGPVWGLVNSTLISYPTFRTAATAVTWSAHRARTRFVRPRANRDSNSA